MVRSNLPTILSCHVPGGSTGSRWRRGGSVGLSSFRASSHHRQSLGWKCERSRRIGDNSRYLQISAPVQSGNSGGPLLDASGHLVGIVTAKLDAMRDRRFTGDVPQNVNFALKTEVVRTFLDSKGIAYQTAQFEPQLSPADVGEIARPFTVQIECEQAGF